MATYNVGKTVTKAVSPPTIILIGAVAINQGAKLVGVEIDADTAMVVMISLYGIGAGVINWIRHRKK